MQKIIATASPARPVSNGLLTDKELALQLSIEPRTLRLWRNTLGLPFIKISGKTVRYRDSDVQGWLARRKTVISPRSQ
jgi:predicted DNA-binding transcriptional regulator AlpA